MHGLTHFLHKHHSRESTPPLDKDRDCSENWYSSDSRGHVHTEVHERGIPINPRGTYAHRSLRIPSGSPFENASSPRDRYPNFASYFRDVMEGRGSPGQSNYYTHHPDYRRQDADRHQIGINTYQTQRSDYRNFVSPLFNDAMDDIQENEYSKCDRYGEISNSKTTHSQYKNRFDNKSFAKKLTDSVSSAKDKEDLNERRGSESSGSCAGHRHKHHSIQELIRTFGKKVGSWRHDSTEGRRGSCAIPVTGTEQRRITDSDEFRSRSKSLDGDHLHKIYRRPYLEDCGATYQIFDAILKEGKLTINFTLDSCFNEHLLNE